ncbi:hypothetical protein H4R19_003824 [Coemansia spiralis]|nr:hypothetical protein H4R19_003824 [Coemansia spiralis]
MRRPWRPTLDELRAYNYLFSLTDHEHHGVVSKTELAGLLRQSTVAPGCVDTIWQLCAAGIGMSRRGFYTAMKLLSLAQAGQPVSLSGLGDPLPLPAIAGVDWKGMAIDDTLGAATVSCSIQPLLSPASTISQLDSDDDHDDDSMRRLLRVDTGLCKGDCAESTTSNSSSDPDHVSELLSRIDEMIGSAYDGRTLRPTQRLPGAKMVAKRGKLEETLAQMQTLCDDESALNQTLAAQVSVEEEELQLLCSRVEAAHQMVAGIAQQRAGLLERLQQAEAQRQKLQAQLSAMEAVVDQCSDEVGQLDAKVFGVERDTARMQRRIRQKMDPDNAAASARPPAAWRSRISSVFGSPPLAT